MDGADGTAGVCALPPVGIALRAIRDQPPPVTPEDIARGLRLWEGAFSVGRCFMV